MVELLSRKDISLLPSSRELLEDGEIIVIVDDSPEIVLLLEHYLVRQNIPVAKASNAEEFYAIFNNQKVALILLDIGLPGISGTEILADIAPKNPDLGIIMVTGSTNIQTALDCLRQGADDYLTKPVKPREFNFTLYQTLKKRRLAIDNRVFQKELELTNFRMQFLHKLNLKMNTAYLNALELDRVLHTILAGITSEDGLQFNRAFLALFNNDGTTLSGKLAIGPSSREEAGKLWTEIRKKNLGLHDILYTIAQKGAPGDTEVNRIARALQIPVTCNNHILIQSSLSRKSILVQNGYAENVSVPEELLSLLDEKNFVVVPLFSPSQSLGVIIADNFVTNAKISQNDVMALEIFANQASLAIEHSHLYRDMTAKIEELELVTKELEKNKDMLIEAERYSTIGYVSAQLVHAIRNPVTSIGGTARLLLKRAEDVKTRRFLKIMAKETAKIEDTLKNLFEFVEDVSLETDLVSINMVLRETLATFYPTFEKKNITLEQNLEEQEYLIEIDARKIRQVFMHLIRNSIEAMDLGGMLKVELTDSTRGIVISILDSGPGIAITDLDFIRNPFYTTKTYGTGLGLSLVEQILDLHDAEFSLEQLSPKGTKATILFTGSKN